MGLRYFDNTLGRERIKRRYVWASWAFVTGLLSGMVLAVALH